MNIKTASKWFSIRRDVRRSSRVLLIPALALLQLASVRAGQQKLAADMEQTRHEILQTRDQLQMTVDAVSALVDQKKGDLRPAYETFTNQVSKTQSAAFATHELAQKMQAEAESHFSSWRSELEAINNQKLRNKAIKRLEAVKKDYSRVAKQVNEASEKFEPYLSDLADMQKMLVNDLSPGSVKNLRSTVSNAKFHLGGVRGPLNDAIKELNEMGKALSSNADE